MALIFCFEVPKWSSVAFQLVGHLARLAHRHSRIVRAGYDERWFGNLLRVVHRSDALHKLPHLRVAFVAILHPAQVAAIGFGVLEKCNQVARPHDRQLTAEIVFVERRDRPGHMPAVAAARHHDAAAVELGILLDPIDQGANVLIGSLAQKSIVELHETLAVSSGSANIRKNYGHSELIDVVIGSPHEARTRLSLRPAMDIDDDRPLPAEFCRIRLV